MYVFRSYYSVVFVHFYVGGWPGWVGGCGYRLNSFIKSFLLMSWMLLAYFRLRVLMNAYLSYSELPLTGFM